MFNNDELSRLIYSLNEKTPDVYFDDISKMEFRSILFQEDSINHETQPLLDKIKEYEKKEYERFINDPVRITYYRALAGLYENAPIAGINEIGQIVYTEEYQKAIDKIRETVTDYLQRNYTWFKMKV